MSSGKGGKPIPLTVRKLPFLLTRRKARALRVAAPLEELSPSPSARPAQPPLGSARPSLPAATAHSWPRWPNLVQVTLISDHNFYCGFDREPGSSGLFVATYTTVPIGERMVVHFTLPAHPGVMSAICEARWVREFTARTEEAVPGVGFAFVRIDAESLGAVDRFMNVREPIFWDG